MLGPGMNRAENWLDGGAPFYNTYECKDGNGCIGCISHSSRFNARTSQIKDKLWDKQWNRDL